MRTSPCDDVASASRLAKAEQFHRSASELATLHGDDAPGDDEVSLLVLSGIAAADVLCWAAIGTHARGESHADAVQLRRGVDGDMARHLDTLLKRKTKAGYSHRHVSADDRRRARRAADALLASRRA